MCYVLKFSAILEYYRNQHYAILYNCSGFFSLKFLKKIKINTNEKF